MAQIQTIWNEAEPLIEKYNAVHEQYQKNKARQEQLQKQIEPLQREVDLGRQRVGVMAAAVYKGGRADAFSAVVTSGSPQQLAEQLAFLDVLSREQDRQLEGVSKSKADLDGQKAPIDALVAELAKQDADSPNIAKRCAGRGRCCRSTGVPRIAGLRPTWPAQIAGSCLRRTLGLRAPYRRRHR